MHKKLKKIQQLMKRIIAKPYSMGCEILFILQILTEYFQSLSPVFLIKIFW